MAIYKRGGVYWYEFEFKGRRIRDSTHQGNQNVARQMEGARRTQLAKGEVGIIDRVAAPTLREYSNEFEREIETVCRSKPATITFYKEKLRRLLEFDPLASARLSDIDENLIGSYRQARSRKPSRYKRPVSAASINRELATLRRLLRHALKQDKIAAVPKVELLRGERNREFVLSQAQEKKYLERAPQPLSDLALLMLDTGLRVGEARLLEGNRVRLDPAVGARFGYLRILEGKNKNAKRNLALTGRVRDMLAVRVEQYGQGYLFPSEDGEPYLGTSLDHQHGRVRDTLKLSKEFVIHSLRHTMLTRLGETGTDAFTIMKIAGHSSITVSQRYVHPSPEAVENAFVRLEAFNARAAANSGEVPTEIPTVKTRRVKKSA